MARSLYTGHCLQCKAELRAVLETDDETASAPSTLGVWCQCNPARGGVTLFYRGLA